MINFDYVKEDKRIWSKLPRNPSVPIRILVVKGIWILIGSGSGKTNSLFNLIIH